MPTKTRLLDYGNFVYSPNLPANPAFSEYLNYADRLLGEWREAQEALERSPLSPELEKRKTELDAVVSDFAASFKGLYSVKSIEQDAAFWPVLQLFSQYRPVRKPFSILHCNLSLPLHTVQKFESYDALAELNAALDERTPLPWWQSGPHNRPCHLFGECVWELKASEMAQSDEGVVLLFLQIAEEHERQRDRTAGGYSGIAGALAVDSIPEKVRILVWRRDRGKCVKCGSHKQLEFDYIVPTMRGGDCTPKNLQLLCNRCYSEKNDTAS